MRQKILQLNAWTGRIKGALLEFIKNNDFDIICLQEAVWSENSLMLEHFAVSVDQIKAASGLTHESRIANWGVQAFGSIVEEGIVILSRDEIIDTKIIPVYGDYQVATSADELRSHAYKAQLVKLKNGLNVVNYHGYWLPNPIGDETTIATMKKVAQLIKTTSGPLIMCGDFNVTHASPAMRELDFLTDLTHQYNISSTLVGLKFNGQVACDHILVNQSIDVTNFSVSDQIISDHKPLIAEISYN